VTDAIAAIVPVVTIVAVPVVAARISISISIAAVVIAIPAAAAAIIVVSMLAMTPLVFERQGRGDRPTEHATHQHSGDCRFECIHVSPLGGRPASTWGGCFQVLQEPFQASAVQFA
jgi:hypothetical protein